MVRKSLILCTHTTFSTQGMPYCVLYKFASCLSKFIYKVAGSVGAILF